MSDPIALRVYRLGLITQAAVARELRVSTRQLQRIEEVALARFTVGMCREWLRTMGDLDRDPE